MRASVSTPHRSVDVAIIGAGTAGLAAYRAAVASTPRVVLIESGAYGTTCARVGCMPSKLLVAAADVAHTARRAAKFGIGCAVEVDGRAVMDRVRRERDRFVGMAVEDVKRIPEEHRLVGRARFMGAEASGARMLEVEGERICARAVVIATGSSPFVPPIFDAVRDRVVVNDDVFEWTTLPQSVAVFGTGVLGLELGQALHRLGVRVRLFGRSGTVGRLTDPVVRAAAEAAFHSELALDSKARVHSVNRDGDGVAVTFDDASGTSRVERFGLVLVATGRRPHFEGLALELAGVKLDKDGSPHVSRATLQCGNTPVFVAGDASHGAPLLHEAADDGKIAGANAVRYPRVQPGPRRTSLEITFSDPQIAIVGASFEDLSRVGELIIGEVSFVDQGRSRILGQDRGAARVYADPASGRFLGAEIAGPRAEHLGHLLSWAHQSDLTIGEMLAMPFYHPVVEEGLRTALKDASAKLEALDSEQHFTR